MRRVTALLAASTATAALLVTGLSACDSHRSHQGAAKDSPRADVEVTRARDLPKALAGFPMTISADDPVYFSAESVLAGTPAFDDPGAGVRTTGSGGLAPLDSLLKDTLKIDLRGADDIISVGTAPNVVTLVRGGQDGKAVEAAAKKAGWSGSGVLSKRLDASEPVSVQVGHIKVVGDSVFLGGQGATLTGKPGPVPRSIADLTRCLGTSPIMVSDTVNRTAVAVGLTPGSTDKGVVCARPASGTGTKKLGEQMEHAVEDGLSQNRAPYSSLLGLDKASYPTASTARLDITIQDGRRPSLLMQMLGRRDLPGLQARPK